jgi:hypothetical protein
MDSFKKKLNKTRQNVARELLGASKGEGREKKRRREKVRIIYIYD